MPDLADRQRFALREILIDEIVAHSSDNDEWDCDDVESLKGAAIRRPRNYPRISVLVELLGEWPVGFRGRDGWEKIECKS